MKESDASLFEVKKKKGEKKMKLSFVHLRQNFREMHI